MSLLLRTPGKPRSSTGNRIRRWLTIGLAIGVLACGSAMAQPLRVMTFNVRLLTDSDGANRWEARRAMVAKMVAHENPDLIGTQELFQRQGDELVARLPQYAWFGQGRRGGNGDEHMGVFYRKDRLRMLSPGDVWLCDTPETGGSICWGNL